MGSEAGETHLLTVEEGEEGRIDRFVASVLELSRTRVQRLLSAGMIKVDGEFAKKSDSVAVGVRIEVLVPPAEPVTPEVKSNEETLTSEAIAATPLARQMSALVGLDLARVTGTGAAGQVTKADIERQLGNGPSNKAATTPLPDLSLIHI